MDNEIKVWIHKHIVYTQPPQSQMMGYSYLIVIWSWFREFYLMVLKVIIGQYATACRVSWAPLYGFDYLIIDLLNQWSYSEFHTIIFLR